MMLFEHEVLLVTSLWSILATIMRIFLVASSLDLLVDATEAIIAPQAVRQYIWIRHTRSSVWSILALLRSAVIVFLAIDSDIYAAGPATYKGLAYFGYRPASGGMWGIVSGREPIDVPMLIFFVIASIGYHLVAYGNRAYRKETLFARERYGVPANNHGWWRAEHKVMERMVKLAVFAFVIAFWSQLSSKTWLPILAKYGPVAALDGVLQVQATLIGPEFSWNILLVIALVFAQLPLLLLRNEFWLVFFAILFGVDPFPLGIHENIFIRVHRMKQEIARHQARLFRWKRCGWLIMLRARDQSLYDRSYDVSESRDGERHRLQLRPDALDTLGERELLVLGNMPTNEYDWRSLERLRKVVTWLIRLEKDDIFRRIVRFL